MSFLFATFWMQQEVNKGKRESSKLRTFTHKTFFPRVVISGASQRGEAGYHMIRTWIGVGVEAAKTRAAHTSPKERLLKTQDCKVKEEAGVGAQIKRKMNGSRMCPFFSSCSMSTEQEPLFLTSCFLFSCSMFSLAFSFTLLRARSAISKACLGYQFLRYNNQHLRNSLSALSSSFPSILTADEVWSERWLRCQVRQAKTYRLYHFLPNSPSFLAAILYFLAMNSHCWSAHQFLWSIIMWIRVARKVSYWTIFKSFLLLRFQLNSILYEISILSTINVKFGSMTLAFDGHHDQQSKTY